MNKLYDLKNKKIINQKTSIGLRFLYHTAIGRVILKILINPVFSKLFSMLTDSFISKICIKSFIKNNHIDMSEYPKRKYSSFNDFFTRDILPDKRTISYKKSDLISPADSKLSVYPINQETILKIKNSTYTIDSLIQDQVLAKEYKNGYCLVFRLCVDDYHHYIHIDNGALKSTKEIKGVLHTVNPIALDIYPVYSENNRIITVLETENFQDVIYIEVGALNVGKINNNNKKEFKKGEEKGYFSFGASTIILLFKENTISVDELFLKNTKEDIETIIKQGHIIGHKKTRH